MKFLLTHYMSSSWEPSMFYHSDSIWFVKNLMQLMIVATAILIYTWTSLYHLHNFLFGLRHILGYEAVYLPFLCKCLIRLSENGNVGKWILWIFRKFPEKSQKKLFLKWVCFTFFARNFLKLFCYDFSSQWKISLTLSWRQLSTEGLKKLQVIAMKMSKFHLNWSELFCGRVDP